MIDSLAYQLRKCERYPHRVHQLVGVRALIEHPAFALFDEVGAGKSKQVVDTAQILYDNGAIDTVLVVAPGFARSTWAEEDPLLGEVAKHAWADVPNVIYEYHAKYDELNLAEGHLSWVVTNYEFIRRDNRLDALLKALRGRKTWLVLDESWMIKNHRSDQARACFALRYKRCERVTLLNGTPLADGSPKDLYSQMAMLDKEILGVKNFSHFRARYAVMGGYMGKQIVSWQHLDELNAKVAPHILSRRTRDCFDLPDMLDPVLIEAKLTDATWKVYRQMRDDLVAWLDSGEASVAKQAVVKGLRLAQITSGYLGGLDGEEDDQPIRAAVRDLAVGLPEAPEWLRRRLGEDSSVRQEASAPRGEVVGRREQPCAIRELGREKLDALLEWLEQLRPRPDKLIVWCRFRLELDRLAQDLELRLKYPTFKLRGGQKPEERTLAKQALAPDSRMSTAAVAGNQGAGGASLNLSGASLMVYLSNDFSLLKRTQSTGRIERPGQRNPMKIVDVVAVGPKGQKTIDHHILKALRQKEEMATWTVDKWRRILTEE